MNNIHPIFAAALAPFTQHIPRDMGRFIVTIGTRERARIVMECMASSSLEATERHLCLALPLERVEVRRVDA